MNSPVSHTSIHVRPYRQRDTASLAHLFTETVHAINANDYSPEQLAAWAPQPPDIGRWHERLNGLIVFVAEENDSEIVGFSTLNPSGYLDHLYIHKNFQRRGIAAALYQRLEQEALSRALPRIFTEGSETARSFFENVGFRMIAPQTIEHGGISFTNYCMEKFLS